MTFSSPYAILFISLFLGLSFFLAWILYVNNKHVEIVRPRKYVLFFIRFSLLFLLMLLLLEPMLKKQKKELLKPILPVLLDVSQSMILNKDSTLVLGEILPWVKSIQTLLTDYDVQLYSFSDSFKVGVQNFQGTQTNISQALIDCKNRLLQKQIAGILLISDGIFNAGYNPALLASQFPYPIHTLAIGDTSSSVDISISYIHANKEVLFNAFFPIEIAVTAKDAQGSSTTIDVFVNDNRIAQKPLHINTSDFSTFITLQHQATKKGLNKLTVYVHPDEREQNKQNNVATWYFNVVEKRKHVLLLAEVVHPDVRSIKEALESYEQFSVDILRPEEASKVKLSNYQLVIYYQHPRVKISPLFFENIIQQKIPAWFIGGLQFNYNTISSLNIGFSSKIKLNTSNDVYPAFNTYFKLFELTEAEKQFIEKVSPLTLPFGDYQVSSASEVMLFQKIGKVVTSQPLLFFNSYQNLYMCFLLAEGIWRWRLKAYAMDGSFNVFDQFIVRIVQFLTENTDRSRFKVKYKSTYNAFEPIRMQAELYNANFELINNVPITLDVWDSAHQAKQYFFEPDGQTYSLNLFQLPPGIYRFRASVKDKTYPYEELGEFSVNAFNPEQSNLKANYAVLQHLANQTGGMFFTYQDKNQWVNYMKQHAPPARQRTHLRYTSLIDWHALFFILVLFASLEWAIRKWEGYY